MKRTNRLGEVVVVLAVKDKQDWRDDTDRTFTVYVLPWLGDTRDGLPLPQYEQVVRTGNLVEFFGLPHDYPNLLADALELLPIAHALVLEYDQKHDRSPLMEWPTKATGIAA